MNRTILFGLIAVVALFVAGCVSIGDTQTPTATPVASIVPQPSATPSGPAVTDAQVDAAVSEVDKALAEMDDVTDELSDINSQDMNSSVVDGTG